MSQGRMLSSESGVCPTDEQLLAYIIEEGRTGLAQNGRVGGTNGGSGIAGHVIDCDRCVMSMRVARSRLQLDAEIDVAVPSRIRDRVDHGSPAGRLKPWLVERWRNMFGRFSDVLRLPVMVPLAAAALLLLFVGIPPQGRDAVPEESTRDVALRQQARVTADSAMLHSEPSLSAEATVSVGRGTTVVLMDERHDWFQVELLDGTPGWMEKYAFE